MNVKTNKQGRQHSLFVRLVVPFALIIVLLIVGIAYQGFTAGRKGAEELSNQLFSNVLTRTERATFEWMNEAALLTDVVAGALTRNEPDLTDYDGIERLLFGVVTAARPDTYIYVGTTTGAYVGVAQHRDGTYSVLIQKPGDEIRRAYKSRSPGARDAPIPGRTSKYDARTRPWFKLAESTLGSGWTPVYSSASRKVLEVSHATPVLGADGKLRAVVSTDVSLTYLSTFLSTLPMTQSGVAYIMDSDGKLIATSKTTVPIMTDKNQLVEAATAADEAIRETSKKILAVPDIKTATFKELRADAKTAQYGAVQAMASTFHLMDRQPLNGKLNWIMGVAAAESDYVKPLRDNLARLAIIGLTALLAALALGVWLIRGLTKDVGYLSRSAAEIGDGQFSVPVHLGRSDEIGVLAGTIDKMRTRLAQSRELIEQRNQQLEDSNESLERRIDERTKELKERNERLAEEIRWREISQRLNDRLSMAIGKTDTAVTILDTNGSIEYANRFSEQLTQRSRDDLISQHIAVLWSSMPNEQERQSLTDLQSAIGEFRGWSGKTYRVDAKGRRYVTDSTLSALDDLRGERFFALVEADITEIEQHAQDLGLELLKDALTGLANRRAFDNVLAPSILNAKSEGKKLGLLFLDLDGFKAVNDRLGHAAGDELLKAVAARLQKECRSSDLVCRFGGDEFVVLALTDEKQCTALAQRIIEAIAEPFNLSGALARLGISIGIALYPDHASDAAGLTARADEAMYYSKHFHKGGYTIWK
jgi:diguanylate cyclase (GGDEF)-like protein/PAS domain S-box-containing protein